MKKIFILPIVLALSIFVISSVSAACISLDSTFYKNINSVSGSYGQVFGWNFNKVQFIGMKLNPSTSYILVAMYGSVYNPGEKIPTDPINYNTYKCLGAFTSNKAGSGSTIVNFNFRNMPNFIVVPTSMINCTKQKIKPGYDISQFLGFIASA